MKGKEPALAQWLHNKQFEQIFEWLVVQKGDEIYRLVLRWVQNEDDARDTVQNTFIKIWKGLSEFRGDAHIMSWVYRIAYNESMGFLRSKREFLGAEILDEQPAPFDFPLAADIEARLLTALAQLPERQRQVFELRYYEEMPYETMAAELGLSVGALKASFHHARKKIEEILLNH